MYKINNPVRITQKEDDVFLLSLPKVNIRIEVNRNVIDFIEYMQLKEKIEDDVVEEYIVKNQIENKSDYCLLFNQMIDTKVVVSV